MMTEIKLAPESVVQEVYDFFLFLKNRRNLVQESAVLRSPPTKPEFLARQKALFGSRVVPDSQVILDELRAERF